MQPTLPTAGRQAPQLGNLGHLTQISNKLVQLGNSDNRIQARFQENGEWNDWQATTLQERNVIENVYRWACGQPTPMQDRTRESDKDDIHDRDYDIAALANNLSQAFRYTTITLILEMAKDLLSDMMSLFTNSNWFAFQDDRVGDEEMSTSPPEPMEEINLNGLSSGRNTNTDDEIVVGEDELIETKNPTDDTSSSNSTFDGFIAYNSPDTENSNTQNVQASSSGDMGFFRFETSENEDPFRDRPIPEWVGWGNPTSANPFDESNKPTADPVNSAPPPAGSALSEDEPRADPVPSLFEDDVEFVGVEEGTEKAREQALKGGTVGEAGALKRNVSPKKPEDNLDDVGAGAKEFNDANYWRVDQEVTVLE
ncbi:hypothetical protein LguiB_001049 [Lonicera macranthoides]